MREVYERIADLARRGIPAVAATVIRTEGSTPRGVGAKMVIAADGRNWGTIGGGFVESAVIEQAASVLKSGAPRTLQYDLEGEGKDSGALCGGKIEILLEPLLAAERLHIFGAGHVARALAELAKRVGFAVTVIDPRPEQANRERFPFADDIVVRGFAEVAAETVPGPDTYVVVLTPEHKHDEEVVRAVLNSPFRYVGMIGSRRKVATLISHLKEAGFGEEVMRKLHSPIGLDIGAETPEEIAVSIVAELVASRRGVETPAKLSGAKGKGDA
ncbi:MAG: XdhC family protein [Candidatus Eisenbacteria sp.]|nr:XdhC family protein [Candidatus Eisenbacteria bacterium]